MTTPKEYTNVPLRILPQVADYLARHRTPFYLLLPTLGASYFLLCPDSAFYPRLLFYIIALRLWLEWFWFLRGFRHPAISSKCLHSRSIPAFDFHRHPSKSLLAFMIATTILLLGMLLASLHAHPPPPGLHPAYQSFRTLNHTIDVAAKFQHIEFYKTVGDGKQVYCRSMATACRANPDLAEVKTFIENWTTQESDLSRLAIEAFSRVPRKDVSADSFHCPPEAWCDHALHEPASHDMIVAAAVLRDIAKQIWRFLGCLFGLENAINKSMQNAETITTELLFHWDQELPLLRSSYPRRVKRHLVSSFRINHDESCRLCRFQMFFAPLYLAVRWPSPSETIDEKVQRYVTSLHFSQADLTGRARSCSKIASSVRDTFSGTHRDLLRPEGSPKELGLNTLGKQVENLFSPTRDNMKAAQPLINGYISKNGHWAEGWAALITVRIEYMLDQVLKQPDAAFRFYWHERESMKKNKIDSSAPESQWNVESSHGEL